MIFVACMHDQQIPFQSIPVSPEPEPQCWSNPKRLAFVVCTRWACVCCICCVCVCVACSVWWHCHANQSASFSNNLISSSFLFSARVECEMVKHWTCNASRASNVAFSSFFLFFWHVYRIVASIGLPIHTILHASRIPDWNIHTNNMCMNGTHTRAPYDRSGDSHVTVCSKCFSFYYINNQEYT